MDQFTTVRKIATLLVTRCLLVTLMVTQGASAQVPTLPVPDVVSYRGRLVRDWVSAVLRHNAGIDDGALAVVRRWGAEDLRDAWVSVNVMVALLRNPTQTGFFVQQKGDRIPVTVASQDLHAMALKARELLQRPGGNHFLKRAALLHSDVALLAGSERPRPPFDSSFLLPDRVFVLTDDGKQEGLYGGDVNWEFARILLDGVTNAGYDPDVPRWYGATLAYMLAVEHFDNPHFEHALHLFPRVADIQFLKGCFHETLANPRVQTVIGEIKVPPRTYLDVRSQHRELVEAESLFQMVSRRANVAIRFPSPADSRKAWASNGGSGLRGMDAEATTSMLSYLRRPDLRRRDGRRVRVWSERCAQRDRRRPLDLSRSSSP